MQLSKEAKKRDIMERLSFHHLPIYRQCSYRRFKPGEKHVTRTWHEHVIIFMIDGSLTFTEDGKKVTVCKNHYYIQKALLRQSADEPSDCPVYFYIHFDGNIEETEDGLPLEGKFDPMIMLPLFQEVEKILYKEQ